MFSQQYGNYPYDDRNRPSAGNFFSRLLFRIKIIISLVFLWALAYSINTIMKNSIAIEYDGGIADSTKSWQAMEKESIKKNSKEYWAKINAFGENDQAKPIPALLCAAAKSVGIKIYVLCDRENENTENLKKTWQRLATGIYFTPAPNDRYVFLEQHKPLAYAASSDENIIQSVKAEILPVRIKRSKKTKLPGNYNPGKFGEKIIPFSQF